MLTVGYSFTILWKQVMTLIAKLIKLHSAKFGVFSLELECLKNWSHETEVTDGLTKTIISLECN